jgi:hypothetical protein
MPWRWGYVQPFNDSAFPKLRLGLCGLSRIIHCTFMRRHAFVRQRSKSEILLECSTDFRQRVRRTRELEFIVLFVGRVLQKLWYSTKATHFAQQCDYTN